MTRTARRRSSPQLKEVSPVKVRSLSIVLSAALVAVTAAGCATKKYVKEETGAVNSRVDQVQGQVEQAQTKLNDHEQRITGQDQRIAATDQKVGEVSKTAQDALQRAQEAGKLAEGKIWVGRGAGDRRRAAYVVMI